jgi:hypothetical protein
LCDNCLGDRVEKCADLLRTLERPGDRAQQHT